MVDNIYINNITKYTKKVFLDVLIFLSSYFFEQVTAIVVRKRIRSSKTPPYISSGIRLGSKKGKQCRVNS